MPAAVEEMKADEFARRLRAEEAPDKRFAFFLGAGCSVTSGIPSAGRLVKERWLPQLRKVMAAERSNLDEWAATTIPGYNVKNPAASYGKLIERLFKTPEDRRAEIESLCDGRSPSFGYAVLAQLVALPGGRFNVVLTTNFDDMVADALYLYTDVRPLVIEHESLALYIRPTRTRPLVVKLHGDHRLSPRNTALETEDLEQAIRLQTEKVLEDRGIIFIGYSGADHGIHKLLDGLSGQSLPYGAYWVHADPPAGVIREWLAKRAGIWVRSHQFDELMLVIRHSFRLPHPNKSRFTRIFANYRRRWQELSDKIAAAPARDQLGRAEKAAATATEATFPDYWKAVSKALRLEQKAPRKAYEVYRRALQQFPKAAPLLGNYATFLDEVRHDTPAADAMYRRAIAADPDDADYLRNYAIFLDDVRKQPRAAEAMYKRAIEADPRSADNLFNYAFFLDEVRKQPRAAEAMYKRAIAVDPTHSDSLMNYAILLGDVRGEFDAAEAMYKRAVDADSRTADNLCNYAIFLEEDRKDVEAAHAMYKSAIAVDPKHSNGLSHYAISLAQVGKNPRATDAMYKRAVKADPLNAETLGNYALFLDDVRKQPRAAEAMYKRAIAADPTDAEYSGNYAVFLQNVRKDAGAAERMYKRAIKANPDDADALRNYALFLQDVRKDVGAAERMYKRAIRADPEDANTLCSYAGLLLSLGQRAIGMRTLAKALSRPLGEEPDVHLECLFYMYGHGPVERRGTSLATLKQLLQEGIRSPGCDLSRNAVRAKQDGHTEAPWLGKLAAVINGDAKFSSLKEWPAWHAALGKEQKG